VLLSYLCSPKPLDLAPEQRQVRMRSQERKHTNVEKVKTTPEARMRSPLWPSRLPTAPSPKQLEKVPSPKQPSTTPDAVLLPKMRGLLNKLTEKNFERLYEQLLAFDICTISHVEALVAQVFEKATTQHFFLTMYVELCMRLEVHFRKNPVEGVDFRKVLVGECQRTFEQNLQTPTFDPELSYEDRYEKEVKFKTRMLGNLRFVGELLSRKLLAGKILLAVAEELLSMGNGEAIEAAATLLEVAGPTFDRSSWTFVPRLRGIFSMLRPLSRDPLLPMRVRCILKDLLDKRDGGWKGATNHHDAEIHSKHSEKHPTSLKKSKAAAYACTFSA